MYKKYQVTLGIMVLISLSGCGLRKDTTAHTPSDTEQEIDARNVDFAICDESFRSLYNDELDEFDPSTEVETGCVQQGAPENAPYDLHEFTWVQESENSDGLKNVCFGYDRHAITQDQKDTLKQNIALVKARIAESPDYDPTIVIEGHSCHSAGQPAYNLALSEKRAKCIADQFIEAGIPKEYIKVVGRGDQVPAIINGVEVTGDRIAQAPNRRCETRIIYA